MIEPFHKFQLRNPQWPIRKNVAPASSPQTVLLAQKDLSRPTRRRCNFFLTCCVCAVRPWVYL